MKLLSEESELLLRNKSELLLEEPTDPQWILERVHGFRGQRAVSTVPRTASIHAIAQYIIINKISAETSSGAVRGVSLLLNMAGRRFGIAPDEACGSSTGTVATCSTSNCWRLGGLLSGGGGSGRGSGSSMTFVWRLGGLLSGGGTGGLRGRLRIVHDIQCTIRL